MAKLPDDIIREILPRLSVKSLVRFKCVGKSWLTLITDPKLVKTHLNRNNDVRFLLLKYDQLFFSPRIIDYQLDWIDNNTSCLQGLEKGFPSQLKSKVITEIGSSCHGLFCITYKDNSACLWNPSTREFKQVPTTIEIPKKSDDHKTISYGLGYDSTIDDYKIVKLVYFNYYRDQFFASSYPIVKVYILGTNTWRQVENHPHNDYFVSYDTSPKLLNGFLHWFLTPLIRSSSPQCIVAFDLANEKFIEVPPPPVNDIYGRAFALWEGCLCIGEQFSNSLCPYDLWVMKDYGVKDSWTKLITISHPIPSSDPIFRPLHLSKTGDVIFPGSQCLYLYDVEHKRFRNIQICGRRTYIRQTEIYVGSLVSLKSDTYVGGNN